MPTPKKGPRLGGSAKHHNMMMSNLATELFRHGRITTTKAKAKNVQPVAERMITFAKRGDLHARRQVLTVIRDKDVVHKLFADIGPASAERNGGYTRVVKLAPRKGDGAEMALIELVDIIENDEGESLLTEAPRRRWSLRRRRNNLSKSAREREEAILAAEDSGEFSEFDEARMEDEDEAADAVPVGSISERELGTSGSTPEEETRAEDQTEVSPEDVEARLAAEDEADEAGDEVAADDGDAAEPASDDDAGEDADDKE